METLSVRCNHCGAPLQVSNGTRFVTCQFCNSSLEVKRTESSLFTEEVTRIAENTGKMAESLEVITLQNEIEKLDREWSSTSGGKEMIGPGMQAIPVAFGIFFACVAFGMAYAFAQMSGIMALVPAVMGLFGLTIPFTTVIRASQHNSRLSEHRARRAELERQLEEMKRK